MMNERLTVTCNHCGAIITGQAYEFEGEVLCEDCFEEDTFVCEECGERHWQDDSYWCEEEMICRDCFVRLTFECDECGERFFNRHNEGDCGIDLCPTCREDYYVRCDNCDELIRQSDAYYHDGSCYCESCYDEIAYPNFIHEYDYKPEPRFRGTCTNNRYFGVELEIAGAGESEENAEDLLRYLNATDDEENCYAKHDGSLCSGIEFVSHPMTLEYHSKRIDWERFMERAVHLGYRSHQTDCCGLHVHVSRKAFGDCCEERERNIAKLIYFVEKHWAEMFQFSRRTSYQVMHWASPYGYEPDVRQLYDKAKEANSRYSGDRYKNINLRNDNTIEFRFFRGTLRYNTFIATLQLVDEICDVAMFLSKEDIDSLSWCQFVAAIDPEEKPELIQYLKERRLYVNEITESEEM